MLIDNTAKDYLLGSKLSNGHKFPVLKSELYERNELLVKLVAQKKILHLGCADHIELIAKKRESGRYLHDLLVKSASLVIGADVNQPALDEMRKFGIENLYHVDAIPENVKFDLILVPDVIEHIGDVRQFLASLGKYKCPIIITTPNAYRLANRFKFKGELVNTDHKYWFSPYTLAKSIYDAGYQIDDYYYTDTLSLRSPIKSILKFIYPLVRDGLVVVFNKRQLS